MADIQEDYEDGTTYRIVLSRVAKLDGLRLRGDVEITGAALKRLIDQEGNDIVVRATMI